jgi:hypothetical protein
MTPPYPKVLLAEAKIDDFLRQTAAVTYARRCR